MSADVQEVLIILKDSPRYSTALNTLANAPALTQSYIDDGIPRYFYSYEGTIVAEISLGAVKIITTKDQEELSFGLIGAIYSGM